MSKEEMLESGRRKGEKRFLCSNLDNSTRPKEDNRIENFKLFFHHLYSYVLLNFVSYLWSRSDLEGNL